MRKRGLTKLEPLTMALTTGEGIALSSGISALSGLGLGGGGSSGPKLARRAIRNYGKEARRVLSPYLSMGSADYNRYRGEALGSKPNIYDPFGGGSDLPQYSPYAAMPNYSPTAGPGAYTPTEGLSQYMPTAAMPVYQKGDKFEFNLTEDPGYQFIRDEAMRAVKRSMPGYQQSGNVLSALQDRASGLAAAQQFGLRQAQLAEDQTNYNRGVTDYNILADRNREMYGRGVTDYGIESGRNRDMYQRGVQDYGIGLDVNRDIYGRGVQDYNILGDRNREMYGRGVTDYGLDYQRNQDMYGRDLKEYGLDVARDQDMYGRNENYLNRLYQMGQLGPQMASNLANIWQSEGSNLANAYMGGAQMDSARSQYMANVLNNAAQGYIGNTILANALAPQPSFNPLSLAAMGAGAMPTYGVGTYRAMPGGGYTGGF